MIDDPISRAGRFAAEAERDRRNTAKAKADAASLAEREERERTAAIEAGRRILAEREAQGTPPDGSTERPAPNVNDALQALAGIETASTATTDDTPTPSDAIRVLFS